MVVILGFWARRPQGRCAGSRVGVQDPGQARRPEGRCADSRAIKRVDFYGRFAFGCTFSECAVLRRGELAQEELLVTYRDAVVGPVWLPSRAGASFQL